MINAVVLAAGESRRMGKPKPLLRFGERTFLAQILHVLRRSRVDQVSVVLGALAERVLASADLSGVEVVINEEYQRGQLSSLAAGLKSLPAETEAIVLCLVDNPFITVAVVDLVIGAFRETGRPIVIPIFEKRRGHPALFARPVFDELLNAPEDEGARHVVHANTDRVLEIEVPERSILLSVDTPEDYRAHFGVEPQVLSADPHP